MTDNVIVYSGGNIVQPGSPSEVFGSPATPEVAAVIDTESPFVSEPFFQPILG